MKRKLQKFTVLSLAVFGLAVTSPVPDVRADDGEIPFSVAHIFFELNNTDGDLGIHALIDGDAWKKLEIEDPNERKILNVRVSGRLGRQGLTEFFFESAEPTLEELSPQRFFHRFPAGMYEIEGETLDGKELESEVELSHVIPAPPQPYVNGLPMAQQCDESDPGYDVTVTSAPVKISWDPVMTSHHDPNGGGAGVQPPVAVVIHSYEVVLEVDLDVNGEEFTSKTTVLLPPGETEVTVPAEFLAQGEDFKYEVLAREANYNQTAVEGCFTVEK